MKDDALIRGWIDECGSTAGAVLPLLQKIQGHYGFLPREVLDCVVQNTKLKASQLYGVATFYAQFRLKPVGKNVVRVCHGTACHVRGAERINVALRHGLKISQGKDTTADRSVTLEEVACLGCCSLAPVMSVNGEVHGGLSGMEAVKVVKRIQSKVK